MHPDMPTPESGSNPSACAAAAAQLAAVHPETSLLVVGPPDGDARRDAALGGPKKCSTGMKAARSAVNGTGLSPAPVMNCSGCHTGSAAAGEPVPWVPWQHAGSRVGRPLHQGNAAEGLHGWQQSGQLPAIRAPERTALQPPVSAPAPPTAPPPPLQLPVTPAAAPIMLQPAPRVTLAIVVASAVCVLSDLDPGGETATGGPHSLPLLARHATVFLTSVQQQVVSSLL